MAAAAVAAHTWTKLRRFTRLLSIESHVVEVDALAVDAGRGRRDPAGEAAGLDDAPHERCDERAIFPGRQPSGRFAVPPRFAHHLARGRHFDSRQRSDPPVEGLVWKREAEIDARL